MKKLTDEQLEELAREKQREYLREWRKKNPDKVKEYNKKQREYMREYMREWRKKNPDKVKEYNQRYWRRRAIRELKENKTI